MVTNRLAENRIHTPGCRFGRESLPKIMVSLVNDGLTSLRIGQQGVDGVDPVADHVRSEHAVFAMAEKPGVVGRMGHCSGGVRREIIQHLAEAFAFRKTVLRTDHLQSDSSVTKLVRKCLMTEHAKDSDPNTG